MNVKKILGAMVARLLLGRERHRATDLDAPVAKGFLPISSTRDDDIFVVGFPKSGNTWMQNLIAGVIFGIETGLLTDRLTQLIVPDVHGCSHYKRLGDFTCFKSHFLPRPDYKRVVYLVRDGRDAMVSYFHMNRAIKKEATCSLADMVLDGTDVFPCRWNLHVRQWLENPFRSEMLVIRYEDLHTRPLHEMRRFCEFAGIERSDDVIQRSINGNIFEMMQFKEAAFGWDNEDWDPNEPFIRRGIVGGYKDEMDAELVQAFENESIDELVELGYTLTNQHA